MIARVHERGEPFATPVNLTTRAPREGEVDGVDYHFVTAAEFQRHIDDGDLLEHAQVYADQKGVSREQLRKAFATGNDVILRVDIQGAATLREVLPDALLVFVVPDDMAQLETRMRERGMDEDDIQGRLTTMKQELAAQDRFDHVLENIEGDLDGTVDRLLVIVAKDRARSGRRTIDV